MALHKLLPNSLPLTMYFYENKSYNEIRRIKIILFSHICNSYDDFKKLSTPDQYKLIRRIERSCYNATIAKAEDLDIRNTWSNPPFLDMYITICAKISVNLENSESLFLKVLNRVISTEGLARMSSQQLRPELHADIMAKIAERCSQVIQYKECNLYKCAKCKSKKCRAENLYNRSLDEGVNIQVTCCDCGHKWTG